MTTDAAALDRTDPYDVVLLDLGLPDTDGLDVCKALRQRGDVPIIVISARSDETDRWSGSIWAPTTTSRSPSACAR